MKRIVITKYSEDTPYVAKLCIFRKQWLYRYRRVTCHPSS